MHSAIERPKMSTLTLVEDKHSSTLVSHTHGTPGIMLTFRRSADGMSQTDTLLNERISSTLYKKNKNEFVVILSPCVRDEDYLITRNSMISLKFD